MTMIHLQCPLITLALCSNAGPWTSSVAPTVCRPLHSRCSDGSLAVAYDRPSSEEPGLPTHTASLTAPSVYLLCAWPGHHRQTKQSKAWVDTRHTTLTPYPHPPPPDSAGDFKGFEITRRFPASWKATVGDWSNAFCREELEFANNVPDTLPNPHPFHPQRKRNEAEVIFHSQSPHRDPTLVRSHSAADLPWRSQLVRRQSGVREALGSNPGQGMGNLDEIGLITVQGQSKIAAPKGIKQISSATSAERGQLVTIIAAVNAIGNALPPILIFRRVHFKDRMFFGGPPGFSSENKTTNSAGQKASASETVEEQTTGASSDSHTVGSVTPCTNREVKKIMVTPEDILPYPKAEPRETATRGKRWAEGGGEIPEETRRPAASSGTIPTCENPGATSSKIEATVNSLHPTELQDGSSLSKFQGRARLRIGKPRCSRSAGPRVRFPVWSKRSGECWDGSSVHVTADSYHVPAYLIDLLHLQRPRFRREVLPYHLPQVPVRMIPLIAVNKEWATSQQKFAVCSSEFLKLPQQRQTASLRGDRKSPRSMIASRHLCLSGEGYKCALDTLFRPAVVSSKAGRCIVVNEREVSRTVKAGYLSSRQLQLHSSPRLATSDVRRNSGRGGNQPKKPYLASRANIALALLGDLKSNPVISMKPHMERVKLCRERKVNTKASERINVHVFTQKKRPRRKDSCQQIFSIKYRRLVDRIVYMAQKRRSIGVRSGERAGHGTGPPLAIHICRHISIQPFGFPAVSTCFPIHRHDIDKSFNHALHFCLHCSLAEHTQQYARVLFIDERSAGFTSQNHVHAVTVPRRNQSKAPSVASEQNPYVPACTTSCMTRRRTDPRALLHAARCAACMSDGLPLSNTQASPQFAGVDRPHEGSDVEMDTCRKANPREAGACRENPPSDDNTRHVSFISHTNNARDTAICKQTNRHMAKLHISQSPIRPERRLKTTFCGTRNGDAACGPWEEEV
ncbi:hypothetical protein PR048_016779 [Dryococelus australis]|uniref:Uncharacterized protein n=1 Tax=Dryococelus australis TaxID=614101 RepID=A0ABQ9H880_9NEOP|nr:hypothetical protein PR048_016779 [Dryococelus australis]